MNEESKTYSKSARRLGHALELQCFDPSEIKFVKLQVQDSYEFLAHMIYDRSCLNWGIWDKKIHNEYQKLNCNFPASSSSHEIYSHLLIYYLIKPLINIHFFDKQLLDISCGNGIGLKLSSELLNTRYALGIDLVSTLVKHAHTNFYTRNKINYMQADAEHLPLENESFDVITNLEASHLYPRIEHFFAEVERLLVPGGFFSYADVHMQNKQQIARLEAFLKTHNNLKIIQKTNITKMVQASIYQRLIINEDWFFNAACSLFAGADEKGLIKEASFLAAGMGLSFLPRWKIHFKNPSLHRTAKNARKDKYWGKKHFFHFLIQKVT